MFSVRKETKKDRLEIERLIYQVLNSLDDNPCYEHYYVCKLRGTKDFNKDLTFVAEEYGKLLGFVTLSNAVIKDGDNEVQTLLLRPVVVHEEYQRRGIGKSLIKAALDEARFFGYKHVFVYGEKEYFAKLGFTSTGSYEVYNKEGKKEKNMLVIQFKIGSLDNVKGRLIEAKVFNEFNQEEFDYYHHALFMVKEKKEIKIKNTKKYTFFFALGFTLIAVLFLILRKNNIVSPEVGLGAVVFAIAGCFASISTSHFANKQKLMGWISLILTIIIFTLGILIVV